jgi:hypothetical protein
MTGIIKNINALAAWLFWLVCENCRQEDDDNLRRWSTLTIPRQKRTTSNHEIVWRFLQKDILQQHDLKITIYLTGLVPTRNKQRRRYKAVVSFLNATTYHTPSWLITHQGFGLHHDWTKGHVRRPHAERLCALLLRPQNWYRQSPRDTMLKNVTSTSSNCDMRLSCDKMQSY